MLRALFTAVALLSLLLFIAFAALWVRGQYVCHYLRYRTTTDVAAAVGGTTSGIILAHLIAPDPWADDPGEWELGEENPTTLDDLSFLWDQAPGDMLGLVVVVRDDIKAIHLPFWFLLLLTLPLPVWWLVRTVRLSTRNRRLGLCPACGYDLRGSAGACPECGEFPKNNLEKKR